MGGYHLFTIKVFESFDGQFGSVSFHGEGLQFLVEKHFEVGRCLAVWPWCFVVFVVFVDDQTIS